MQNQPESLTGPLSTRGRRRHVRTLLGVATAPAAPRRVVPAPDSDPGARVSLPMPAAPPRPRSEVSDEPVIESQAWAPHGESLQERIDRTGSLTLVEASALLDQLVDFSVHQPDDGLVHCPTTKRVRILADTAGSELSLVGVDGEAPDDDDYQSMVFQLGVVLYAALTGQDPFPGRTPAQAHLLRTAGRYRPATHLNHALPQGIDDFFVRTFSVDHTRRFASVFEMRSALRELIDHTLPPPRVDVASQSSRDDLEIPVELEEPEPLIVEAPLEDERPSSAFRVDDAVAAGLTVRGPKRTGRILFGMALLAAATIAATTFIARDVEEPPTREETEQLVRTIRTEAVELGDKVGDKVEKASDRVEDVANKAGVR